MESCSIKSEPCSNNPPANGQVGCAIGPWLSSFCGVHWGSAPLASACPRQAFLSFDWQIYGPVEAASASWRMTVTV